MMDGIGWKPNVEISPNCPRCGSSNTKFCYYNNYSLTQPRYFCKGCRRYWTKGGSLRNIPVGGGCRKNRRGRSLRLSSDHHHHISNRSKSCPNIDSSVHSTDSDGNSHIDLALVYANFLNPQPDLKSTHPSSSDLIGMQELECEFDPYLDFTNLESNTQLQNPDSATEAAARNDQNEQFMYYGGTGRDNSMLLGDQSKQQSSSEGNNGLPPLPGEEGASLWSNHNHSLEMSQQQETQDPNSLLFGNWCPFDLTSDDHVFPST